jgi:hypothetical protein
MWWNSIVDGLFFVVYYKERTLTEICQSSFRCQMSPFFIFCKILQIFARNEPDLILGSSIARTVSHPELRITSRAANSLSPAEECLASQRNSLYDEDLTE